VPAPTDLLGDDACSLLAGACLGGRKCALQCPLLKEGVRPLFYSLSKPVLELLMAAQGLEEKFGTCLQKRIVDYKLKVEGLVPVYFICQKALKPRRELGFRMNCNLQLFLFSWLRQLPKQWLL